jgi:glycosyltransferase involved in cell wall biosynthesis
MRKKILIITPFFYGTGGAETFVADLIAIMRRRYEVDVCTIQSKQQLWKGLNWARSLKTCLILALVALFRHGKGQEEVLCLGLNAALVGAILRVFRGWRFKVVILSIYGFRDRPFFSMIIRFILNQSDTIFTESLIEKSDLLDARVDPRKIKIFTHWADQERFFPIEHNNAHLKVLFVGRPIKEKGKHIIEAVEKELWEVDFEYVEDVKYENLPRHYQMADVLVVPSLYDESPNRVVAEGASCGCVVIVSDKGALPEQVRGFGIITKPTSDYFKYHIAILASDKKKLKLSREITIKYAQKHFTEKNALTITEEF